MISIFIKNPITNIKRPVKHAFDIGYLERSNNLFTGKFSLPATDDDTKRIKQFSFIEIYDGSERVELFVVVKSAESYGSSVPTIKYELLDALFLLNLSVIEFLQLVNPTTKEALEAVLDYQYLPYWKLGDCEFSRGFSYSWENENGLLDPLMSVIDDTGERYVIERDTTQFPFILHFRRPRNVTSARVKQGYNMRGFSVEQEGKNLVNWILPKGNAEGINAVDITKVNNGIPYLMDQESMNEFFPAMTIWKDERFDIEQNLKDAAQSRLDAWKQPLVTWNVDAVDMTKVLKRPENIRANGNRAIKANTLKLNDLVIVDTEKHGKIPLRVLEKGKSDVVGNPGELELKITNENISAFAYDEKRQQEISKMTSNGAQNIIPYIFDREADENIPVEFTFQVPDEAINVNSASLYVNTTRYRATAKGNVSQPQNVSSATSSAGGAFVQTATSSSGGSFVQTATSSSGGASVQSATSESAGQSTQTSSANGGHSHDVFINGSNPGTTPHGLRQFTDGYGNLVFLETATALSTKIRTAETVDNHSHSVTTPAHTHNVSISIPNHTHNVSIDIPAHTHNVSITIPAHTHDVSIVIPGHTHDIIFGIFEYSQLPTKLDIWVDDTKVPITDVDINDFDLVQYLRKGSDGKVVRGGHTLKIKPDDLARLEIQIILTVFIKSRLGGKY